MKTGKLPQLKIMKKELWLSLIHILGHTKEYIEVAVETKENLAGKIEEVFLKDFIDNEIMLATRKVLY